MLNKLVILLFFLQTLLAAPATASVDSTKASGVIEIPQSIIDQSKEDQTKYQGTTNVEFTNLELYQHALLFAETFLYPNNLDEAKAINSTFFSEDCVGRIDITRVYKGQELNTEYLFGLFVSIADTDLVNIFGYATDYEIYEFNGYADQYSMSIILTATFPLFNNASIPFEANIYIKLNEQKQINQYDLQFKRWDRFYDLVQKKGIQAITGKEVDEVSGEGLAQLQKVVAKSICDVHENYCAGTDYQQYNSTDDCINHLTNTVPFGKAWEGGRDSVFCRSLHQNMVSYRPSVHCEHIGPSGGDMCINGDTGYEEVVFNFRDNFGSRPFINF